MEPIRMGKDEHETHGVSQKKSWHHESWSLFFEPHLLLVESSTVPMLQGHT